MQPDFSTVQSTTHACARHKKARENEILWRLSNSGFIFALQMAEFREAARTPPPEPEEEMHKYLRCVLEKYLLVIISIAVTQEEEQ